MNKNLLQYQERVLENIDPFSGEAVGEELRDWMLYQLGELSCMLQYHIHHRVKTRHFDEYFHLNKTIILNEWLRVVKQWRVEGHPDVIYITSYTREIKGFLDSMARLVEDYKRNSYLLSMA